MAFLIITMIVYPNSITQGGCPYVLIFRINALPFELKSLFVFTMVGPKQNAGSLLTPDSDTVFGAFSQGTLCFDLHGSYLNHFLQGENSSTTS